MESTKHYSDLLAKLNMRNWLVGRKIGLGEMLLRTLLALILLPIFIIMWLLCIVPYMLPDKIIKNPKDKRMTASFRFAVGSVLTFPVWNLLLFGLSFLIPWPWWCSLVFLAVLILLPKPFILLRHWFVKFYHRWRFFAKYGKDSDLTEAIKVKEELENELKDQ